MSIIISGNTISADTIIFTIISGSSSSLYASFEWYLNDVLVGTESIFKLVNPLPNYFVYVKVKDYLSDSEYWHGGQFYGGSFTGNFAGGTFHYGNLNGVQFFEQSTKPKPFIQNI